MVNVRYYVKPTTKPGDSISWGALSDKPEIVTYEWLPEGNPDARLQRVTYEGIPFTPIPYCTFGDYDNSTAVERSNARVMLERFPWLVTVTGDYGSQMVGYLGEPENQNPNLIEAIEALDGYPVADESDMSDLEMTMEWESWCDWGRRDFAGNLPTVLDEIDPGYEHDVQDTLDVSYGGKPDSRSPLDDLWHSGCDAYNVNGGTGYVIEGGGGVHFYVDEWCEQARRAPAVTSYGSRATYEMRDRLLDLARQCRTGEVSADE